MMKKPSICLFFISLLALGACNFSKDRTKVDVSDITVPEVKIHRYDADLFKVNKNDLPGSLKAISREYPFFLGTDLDNPQNISSMMEYLDNPRNQDFSAAVVKKFKDLSQIEKDLTEALRHVKYYYPQVKIPRVYTYISGGDYENPVRLVDSVLLIALDCYLGKDFKPYEEDGLPVYKIARMIPEQIVPDCMRAYARDFFPPDPSSLTLLEVMVEEGKRLYLAQSFMPDLKGDLLMRYTPEQYQWVKENEVHVWAAIIDNKMLYSTEGKNIRTFMADGPFTPEFSKVSAPRTGEWIGVQIIRSFMQENKDISLQDMLKEKDAQRLLQHSGYKPEK